MIEQERGFIHLSVFDVIAMDRLLSPVGSNPLQGASVDCGDQVQLLHYRLKGVSCNGYAYEHVVFVVPDCGGEDLLLLLVAAGKLLVDVLEHGLQSWLYEGDVNVTQDLLGKVGCHKQHEA